MCGDVERQKDHWPFVKWWSIKIQLWADWSRGREWDDKSMAYKVNYERRMSWRRRRSRNLRGEKLIFSLIII